MVATRHCPSAPPQVRGQYVCGNYLDEVWTIDKRSGGVTVADLNDGTGSDRHFYHQNTLYHVYALTDETGAIAEAVQSYDAYGKISALITGAGTDGNWFTSDDVLATNPNVSAIGNPWFYTGQRVDPETGLYYYKNRYHSPELGRFVSRDPIGYEAGALGLYEYVRSSPQRYFDPIGLNDFDSIDQVMKAFSDLVTIQQGWWNAGPKYIDRWQKAKKKRDEFEEEWGNLIKLWSAVEAQPCTTATGCDCWFKLQQVQAERGGLFAVSGHLQVLIVRLPKGQTPSSKGAVAGCRSVGGVASETVGGQPGGQANRASSDWVKFDCAKLKDFFDYLVRTKNRNTGGYNLTHASCATLGHEAANCFLGPASQTPVEDYRTGTVTTGYRNDYPIDAITEFQDYCSKNQASVTTFQE